MRLNRILTLPMALLCVAGSAAGCAHPKFRPSSGVTDSASASPSSSLGSNPGSNPGSGSTFASPLPSASASGKPGTPKPGNPTPPPGPDGHSQQVLTLTGTVDQGVERCLILHTSSGDYQLIGGDPKILTPGARVRLYGKTDPGLLTTCQQGTPFRVMQTYAD